LNQDRHYRFEYVFIIINFTNDDITALSTLVLSPMRVIVDGIYRDLIQFDTIKRFLPYVIMGDLKWMKHFGLFEKNVIKSDILIKNKTYFFEDSRKESIDRS
jgi:hypothetical protein